MSRRTLAGAGERPPAFTARRARKEAYLKGLGISLARGPHLDCVGAGGDAAVLTDRPQTDVAAPDGFFAACAVRDDTS